MESNETIRVMLVDDHDMVRRGLAAFLNVKADLELVGEARDGVEALSLIEDCLPDVILMDLLMPKMDGVTTTRKILQKHPSIQIIALTSFQDQELIRDALQAGAIGYLLKNVSIDDLAAAIRAAYAGQSTLAPEAVQALLQVGLAREETRIDYGLTAREMEVLELMVAGLNNREIAEKLFVSRATAKAHVSHILGKMDVSNRAEAITLAFRNKLVE